MMSQTLASWCSSTAAGPVTRYSSVGEAPDGESKKTRYSSFVYGERVAVYAYPIVVAWDSSDLSLFSTATTLSSPTAVPASNTPEPSNSLSAGARAGIGVGVAVGVVILIGIIWVALWRRHKRRQKAAAQKHPAGSADDDVYTKGELPGVSKEQAELDGNHLQHEVDGRRDPAEADNTARAELDCGWRGWEAPTAGRTRSL